MIHLSYMIMSMVTVHAAKCHECSFVASNCTTSGLASESPSVPVDVCDAQGRIVQDDLFCGNDKCECGDGFSCVSLEVGCGELMLHKPSRRCISAQALEQRFHQCSSVIREAPDAPTSSNVDGAWIHFDDPDLCTHPDCLATRAFIACGEVECGTLVSVWRDNADIPANDRVYHFVIDGTSKSVAGEIHFRASASGQDNSISCATISSEVIPNCYVDQTRNEPPRPNGDGTTSCVGKYYRRDETKSDVEYSLAVLTWPVYLIVITSCLGAIMALAIALYFVYYLKRNQEMEGDEDLVTKTMDDSSEWKHTSDRVLHLRQRMKQEPSLVPASSSLAHEDEGMDISQKQVESV